MMQASFSEQAYTAKKKQTRGDHFLSEKEAVTLWTLLAAVIAYWSLIAK